MTPAPEIWTPAQAAQALQVSEWLVYDLLRRGKLAGRKAGRQWRTTADAVSAFMAENNRPAQPGTAAGPQPRQRSRPAPPSAPIAVDDWLGRQLRRKTAR